MSLTFQSHSPRERPSLGIMKHTKPETQDYLNKSFSGTVTICKTKPTIPSVPTEVKDTEQESKINELTKFVQMLIDEKVNSTQKTQESNSQIQQTESSKSVDSSKKSQDSKPKVQNVGSSKSLRPKPNQKPQIKCELCHYTNNLTDDCYRILYCMICKREDYRTSDHEMYNASLKRRHNHVIHIRGGVLAESSQSSESSISVKCHTCGSNRYIREPIWYQDSGCSRSMTGVKSYLHKYVEQLGLEVVFGDNSSCITEGYGSINCRDIIFIKVAFVNGLKYNLISISQLYDAKYIIQFDDKQGTIFNANKEMVLIAPRRNDVYVLDMSSLSPNGACFFAKASESVNWLWHKRLSHLNFKNINKLAKQNKVLSLLSLVYSKDKPCTPCEKGKHHKASFKTKQNFFIRKCLHLLHMDLFRPVSPMSINHEKYTLVIVDEYSRYTWVYFLRKKSQAPEMIMSFIRMDHLSKFDAKADDRYFLGYSFVSKAFRVVNKRRQQIEETYHVIFDESIEATRFTHTLEDDIGIDDSSRYPYDEFVHEDDPSRQYQKDSDIPYYVIPHGRSLSELTQENQVPEVIAPNEPDIPHTEDTEGPPNLINTEGTHEQNDRWSRDQNIELVNIIGDPGECMLTRSMDTKLTAASASECLFADFLFEIEPKKVSEELKHPGWVDAMQEELNQFYRNKVWNLVPLPYGKIAIGSKWVFRNKKDEHGTTTKNKARLVAQGYSQEEGIDYDQTFASLAKMEAIKIFLAFATYMNFKVYQMDFKSAFLNGKLKEEVYVKQPPGFESSEFPDYVCKLDKALYGLKQAPRACSSVKTPMIPPNKLGPGLAGKPANETLYKGMIRSLMYLTATRPDIQFSTVLYARYQSNLKESHLTVIKRILSAKKQQSLTMSSAKAEYVVGVGCCTSILWMKSQLSDYDIYYNMVPIFCDNTSAIAISNNPVLHSSTKYIDIRYHFIRDHILKGDIELHFIPTKYQLADIFTKPLDEPTFTRLKAELGMLNIDYSLSLINRV
ncbi:retrovirus-related pol polyprotein from transposon TNT 1-94 [Tanacetum coccineum]